MDEVERSRKPEPRAKPGAFAERARVRAVNTCKIILAEPHHGTDRTTY
jgi:hypothetical protein